MSDQSWWYNVRTRQVEQGRGHSRGEDRLGPYQTREEAERALDTVRARNETWEAEDRAWSGEGD